MKLGVSDSDVILPLNKDRDYNPSSSANYPSYPRATQYNPSSNDYDYMRQMKENFPPTVIRIDCKPRCSCAYDDSRLDRIQGDTDRLRSDHEDLKNKANDLLREIERLKAELDRLRGAEQEANDLRRQLDDANYKLRELDDLRRENEDLKRQLAGLEDLRRENDDLRRQNEDLRRENDDFRRENERLQRENDDLKRELANLRAELEDLRIALKNAKKPIVTTGLDNQYLNVGGDRVSQTIKGEIIKNTDELQFITRKINRYNKKITLNLLYKASIDGDQAAAFHQKCDNANSSLVLVETPDGKRFGGYTSKNWRGNGEEKNDENAFVFTLRGNSSEHFPIVPGEKAIGCYPKYGAVFLGCQIRLYDNCLTRGGSTYEKGLNYNTSRDFVLTDGVQNFQVKEVEVYGVTTE